jgi:hypothetical protein
MNTGPGWLGKWVIVTGLVMVAVGAAALLLGRLGLFRLPGDLEFSGRNWRVYIPITTSILLSAILTLIVWVIMFFRR